MPIESTAGMDKRALRARYLRLREEIVEADRQRYDAARAEHLLAGTRHFSQVDGQRTIALYSAFRAEADLSMCFRRLWASGHQVAFPSIDKQTKCLQFYVVQELSELKLGEYGISEPCSRMDRLLLPELIDIVCVPGVAFTATGCRLGYGGGYYDRLFANSTVHATRVGIAYDVQVAPSLPMEVHDIQMNYLLTEVGWLACQT